MINFDIKSPQDTLGVVKATVHKNGKLGFSTGAATKLELERQRYFQVATNADDPEDESLYLIPAKAEADKAFKANKAGNYYYMRLKHLFDEMDLDYRHQKIIYDIRKCEEQDMLYYKLERRKRINKK